MIVVREAQDKDVEPIRDIFVATYQDYYPYAKFYDTHELTKMVYNDDTVLLVAEDTQSERAVGTASVVMDVGAHSDLIGEFGRLAIHPDDRGKGIGKKLMRERVKRVERRLHVGLVENRVAHPFSQKISQTHRFVPVGFEPMKLLVDRREHVAIYVRYFGNALALRRNNPRVIPEAHRLGCLALGNCGLACDCIVDDTSAPYPANADFQLETLTEDGYSSLLRIERGRVRHRDIFGPLRLHYGLFHLQSRHSNYLIARRRGQLAGAIGYIVDEEEKAARVFELISLSDEPIRFLLQSFVDHCRDRLGLEFLEVDVNADSARMQRTLLELDFLPTAYVPAMVFHDVERLDAVRMVRLLTSLDLGRMEILPIARPVVEEVCRGFAPREIDPRLAIAVPQTSLFNGLNQEQIAQIVAICQIREFPEGAAVVRAEHPDRELFIILAGAAEVTCGTPPRRVGAVGGGQCLGESILFPREREVAHGATAAATQPLEAAAIPKAALTQLIRRRPDIGVIVYRNLAADIHQKLQSVDQYLAIS